MTGVPFRWARVGCVAVLLVASLLAACQGASIPIVSGPTSSELTPIEAKLLREAPVAAMTKGCSEVQATPEYRNGLDRTHIGGADDPTPPPLASYPTVPPASGPHNPVPLPAGVYAAPPDVYRTIHSLEHAAVVIWYAPEAASDPATAAEIANIQAFFEKPSESDHVIVAPYDYPDQGVAGHLPAGTSMALVAWHRLQLCRQPGLPVAFAFVDAYRYNPEAPDRYRGKAPEPGVPIG
jgi:hypothetical protein